MNLAQLARLGGGGEALCKRIFWFGHRGLPPQQAINAWLRDIRPTQDCITELLARPDLAPEVRQSLQAWRDDLIKAIELARQDLAAISSNPQPSDDRKPDQVVDDSDEKDWRRRSGKASGPPPPADLTSTKDFEA